MLRELRIKNFAIIDDLELRFGPGLNVITGETGAGKSILLRALGLLCGERASADLVRGDTDEAVVEGVFDMPEDAATVEALGLDRDDESVVVRRHVGRNGKGRIYVNGGAAAASMLRSLGNHLVNIYGQHDQALLLRAANHLDYLDAFGDNGEALAAMRRAYEDLRVAHGALQEIEERARQLAERRDLLEFQRQELAALAPTADEEDGLRGERERLRHAERIARVCGESEEVLYAANDAMVARLARLSNEIASLAAAVPDFASAADLVEQGRLHLEEAALQLRTIASRSSADPRRLDEVEERLALLSGVAKKYGVPSTELPAVLAHVEEKLAELHGHEEHRGRAAEVLAERLATAARCAADLSARRRSNGAALKESMGRELADLGMDGAVFTVRQETSAVSSIDDLGADGADRVEFFLSANRGEPEQPLSRAASGGELSRILLGLKALTATLAETPILIFDEVDAGIGGKVADAVARKLRALSETRQILCITHLPQIAASADRHFAVEKRERDGRTISETRCLADDDRIAELSRMLGGNASTEAARYARELIAQVRKSTRSAPRQRRGA